MTMAPVPGALHAHQFAALQPGPRLIVLGAVHGNETCGTVAIRRAVQDIEQGKLRLVRGTLTLVPVTNPLAYQLRTRQGERNLNRNMGITATPADFEDQVTNVLCRWLEAHEVLLDLHSFHTAGEPFAMIGPPNNNGTIEPFGQADAEEALALRLGVSRFVEGWLDTYARGASERRARGIPASVDFGVGTTEYMRRVGGCAITLECGQHEDPHAPNVAYTAVRNALAHLKMTEDAPPPPAEQREVIRLAQVVDRLHPEDRLLRDWKSFELVRAGEVLAYRHDGSPLSAAADGWIVFPNPDAAVDQEWFYLAQASHRLRT